MDRPTCATCLYWLNDAADGGWCQRRPPVVVPLLGGEAKWWATQPESCASDWCGEHPDFPAFIASRRTSATPHASTAAVDAYMESRKATPPLPIKAGDVLYWDGARFVHKATPTDPPSGPE